MVAGHWIGPIYDHEHYGIGNLRGELKRVQLSPRMSDTSRRGLIHYRTKIHDNTATTYFNGRKIHDQPLEESPNPWLAIRSIYRHDGGVDDLRITGTPTIPETISLVESSQLLGWYDYFQSPDNASKPLSDWRASVNAAISPDAQVCEIMSPHASDATTGSHVERLLVYARPMIEDGVIEYEFWYAPEESVAHPTVGRQCFLLEADGVKLHQVTDGEFERSALRPDNKTTSTSPLQLPLRPSAWNRMRVEQQSNSLTLILNGTQIYETNLETDRRDRTFGLFHYADQTELRVRNPKWTGSWPKELPEISQQILSEHQNHLLDQSARDLSKTFTHRFDENSLIDGRFVVVEGDPSEDFQVTEGGIVVHREGRAGYQAAFLSPAINVGGDFDVTVSYDQLLCDAATEKMASVRMNVVAGNDASDHSSIIRADNRSDDQIVQCLKMQTIKGSDRRHYFESQPMEANAGRLRFSRRDDVIYYLIAENDSKQFRIIGKKDYVTDDLPDSGIQFGPQVQGVGSRVSVRFTKFEVRADRLSGIAIEGHDDLIAKLNAQRDQLPVTFEHDFSKSAPDEQDFFRWTDSTPWATEADGLIIEAPGSDQWSSAGLSIRRQFEGDFDVLFRFDQPALAIPKQGDRSEIYLQIELGDSAQTQLNSMLRKIDSGQVYSQAQIRRKLNEEFQYEKAGTLAISDPDYLRILRRGTDAYFIAGKQSSQQELLLGTTKTSDSTIRFQGVKMMVHTGGNDRISSVLVKSISVKAEKETGLIAPPVIRSRQSPPNTIFDSVRDLFR